MGNRPRQPVSRGIAPRPTASHREAVSPPRPWGDESRHGIFLTPAVLEDLSEEIADRLFKRLSKQPALVDRYRLSDLISISVPTIERLQRDGRIPVVRIGRRVLYDVNAVLAALSEPAVGAPFVGTQESVPPRTTGQNNTVGVDPTTPSDHLLAANEGGRSDAH